MNCCSATELFLRILINFKQLIPISKMKTQPNSNKITNQSVLAMAFFFWKKSALNLYCPSNGLNLTNSISHAGRLWFPQLLVSWKDLVQKDHPFFSSQLHIMQMNIGWRRVMGKKRLLIDTNWETVVSDSRGQMKYWKAIVLNFSYKDHKKLRKTHIWSCALQILKLLISFTLRNRKLPRKLTFCSFIRRKQIWTSQGSNAANSPNHPNSCGTKTHSRGAAWKQQHLPAMQSHFSLAWGKLFGLPPFPHL